MARVTFFSACTCFFPVILREKMSFIRKIAKEKEQQSKDKSAENESSGSVNIQGKDLKQMFQWC